jgi:hypothetical protein
LVRKPEGKIPLGKFMCRWVYIIKIILKEIGCKGVNWTHMSQDRIEWHAVVNMLINIGFYKKQRIP